MPAHPTRTTLLLAAVSLAPALATQGDNILEHYVGSTAAATRGALGTDAGWLVKRVADHAAVGNDLLGGTATNGSVSALKVTVQDQDGSTGHTFRLAVLAEDSANPGRPLFPARAQDLLVDLGSFTTPTSGSTAPAAWLITLSLATPANVLPVDDPLFLGLELPALTPPPTVDGLFAQIGYLTPGSRAPDQYFAWSNSFATFVGHREVPRFELLTASPVLEAGGAHPAQTTPVYGPIGQHPDAGAPIALRIRDVQRANTPVAVFASLGPRLAAPVSFPALGGWLCLPPAQLLPFAVGVTQTGRFGEVELRDVVPTGLAPRGTQLTFQAVVMPGTGSTHASNAVDVEWH